MVELLEVSGIDVALYGLGLNKGVTSDVSFDDFKSNKDGIKDQMINVANRLSKLSSEHRKFLRQITIAIKIKYARYWLSQFDTYKVGTTAQSESTMHTILKQDLTHDNFYTKEHCIIDMIISRIDVIKQFNCSDAEKIKLIKEILPESFLQKRLVTMNYEVFANIYKQRHNHRLPEWKYFCRTVLELLPEKQWII